MKTLDWLRTLETFLQRDGKKAYTVTELGNISGESHHALNVTLSRLRRSGVLVRYSRGVYGLPGAVSAEEAVPIMDDGAYVTGQAALFRHGLVTQRPVETTCFTFRRHGRSRVRRTPDGRIVQVCVKKPVYAPPAEGILAGPEQALCDYVYLCSRAGLNPESLVTFRNLERLDKVSLRERLRNYPASVTGRVEGLIASKLPIT